MYCITAYPDIVALLAEGVDRNAHGGGLLPCGEIVALLAEGVDRNPFTLAPVS